MKQENFMKRFFATTFIALLIGTMVTVTVVAQNRGNGWPPANILQEYGIVGMPQPSGTTYLFWHTEDSGFTYVEFQNNRLVIDLEGPNTLLQVLRNWFESNSWNLLEIIDDDIYVYNKNKAFVYFDFTQGTGMITAGISNEEYEMWE